MAKHAGAFKSDKRRKELARQKKQEEKRQKRLKKAEALQNPQNDVTESASVSDSEAERGG